MSRVIPNAVDVGQFDAPVRGRREPPRVGFVYAHNPIKGADRCRHVVELARRRIPDLQVLAFGADEPSDAMPLPPGTEYHRHPEQHAIAGLYARCDAWLFATRIDSFGLPVLEAMACRTPVVGLPVGAAPDLLTPDAGVLVHAASEAESAPALSDALVDLLAAPADAWQRMSECAHRRAHGYTWDDAVDRFESELECAHRAPPSADQLEIASLQPSQGNRQPLQDGRAVE